MMTTNFSRLVVAVALCALASSALAQTPAPAAQPPAKAPATAPAPQPAPGTPAVPPGTPVVAAPPTPPANYTYSVDGRRDPFVSLLNRGAGLGNGKSVKRGDGVAGMLTQEMNIKGIVQSRGVYAAMVSGADNKVYTIRAGDRLADGVVRTVTAQFVVILQEVNDPLSLEKQREVRKFLRGGEEVK